jgi:hypothetical protein
MFKPACKADHGCCHETKDQPQDPMRCCTLSSTSPKVTEAAQVPDFVAEIAQSAPASFVPLAEISSVEPVALQKIEKRFLLLQSLRL